MALDGSDASAEEARGDRPSATRAMTTAFIQVVNAAVFAYTSPPFFPASQPIKFAPIISPPQITLRESWRESDTSTIYGRSRQHQMHETARTTMPCSI